MKLVKEYINEKFIEDSDPIKDLGIGVNTFDNLKPGDIIECKKTMSGNLKHFIHKGEIKHVSVVLKILDRDKENLWLELIPFLYMENIVITARNEILRKEHTTFSSWKDIAPISQWKKYFRVLQNREIKLYESL